jgi:ATP-dependent Clp protease ATP-binding subunit ClpB
VISVIGLTSCEKEANKRNDQFIAGELFLLVVADDKGELGKVARENGLNRKSLEAAIDLVRGGESVNSADAEGQREALKKYTVDLTERARMGKLDPVIGRDDGNSSHDSDSATTRQKQPRFNW